MRRTAVLSLALALLLLGGAATAHAHHDNGRGRGHQDQGNRNGHAHAPGQQDQHQQRQEGSVERSGGCTTVGALAGATVDGIGDGMRHTWQIVPSVRGLRYALDPDNLADLDITFFLENGRTVRDHVLGLGTQVGTVPHDARQAAVCLASGLGGRFTFTVEIG